MLPMEIAKLRLYSHHLAGSAFERPDEAVSWLGAAQAQEYAGAKWGLAQRMDGMLESELDRAFNRGTILRTHLMRPTWHFVTPADIRWLLRLTAPRVHTANAYYYRKFGLDAAVFVQSERVLERALQGNRQRTRSELEAELQQAGLAAPGDDRLRLAYLLMHAELEGLICSGARRGKQHTYALLEERVPPAPTLEREEALAELVRRYFTSHGPATVKDFCGWSGLLAADARAGLEQASSELVKEELGGETHWFAADAPSPAFASPLVHLLPVYDEYTIAYRDYSAILDSRYTQQVIAGNGIVILLDGQIVGAWKRTFSKGAVGVALNPFTSLSEMETGVLQAAARRYGVYLGMRVILE